MSSREALYPARPHALFREHGYAAAIRSGDFLFVSGMVGAREDGSPEPDFTKQVELAFAILEATLAAAGCGFGDIVDLVIDGGIGGIEPSTVVKCTEDEPEIVRQGKGWLEGI